MNRILLVLVSFFIMGNLFSQKGNQKVLINNEYTTASGLKYILFASNPTAVRAEAGDKVSVHYAGTLMDGTPFDDSYQRNQPFTFNLGKGQVIKGWDEGIAMLHIGDSALLIIPPDLGYGSSATGAIPANSTLKFIVKLVDVKKGIKPIDATGMDTVKTSSGLNYIVLQKGRGVSAKSGNKVKVHYAGFLSDGTKFDASRDRGENAAFEFIIGRNSVIRGWEEGIEGMKMGELRKLIIPYTLAYGEQGRPPVIPPKSTLIFDVELMDITFVQPLAFYDTKGLDTLTTASGLKYIKVKKTNEQKVEVGDTVIAMYSGFFRDGKVFDSSIERNDSIKLIAGMHQVIQGWDEALLLLNQGEKARLIIPYQLAYGEAGRPPVIPAKADLLFDIYILRIGKAKH